MPTRADYVMGHEDRERRRLSLQAAILNPVTREFLIRAGLEPGMRVLDLGCGPGDVTFLAAELVGAKGQVTALDCDQRTLELARSTTVQRRISNVVFEHGLVIDHTPREPYDAVIGRHILIHMPDPRAALQHVVALVASGGIVAFHEYDLSRIYPSTPPKPLYEKTGNLLVDFFSRFTSADIGMQLYGMFGAVGLTAIKSCAEIILDGGEDSLFYEWVTETIRTLLPKMEAAGMTTAADLDLNTLADRLRAEALQIGGSLSSPTLVGTFGRKP